ncbi:MAG TPA: DNA-processing protein DprA [Anaerolineae bacterium]|nr:DNA-processing protein DprA [Anaerolineae bacterium]HPL27562.1 DNA-processing protein DprA [Anaerolineae bacterium]
MSDHLAAARARLGQPVTAALTATATPHVQGDIVRLPGLGHAQRIVTGFNRPNLSFQVRYTPELPAKLEALRDLLAAARGQGGLIVYTGTRADAEEIAEFVRRVAHIPAEHYHAGLDAATRARVEESFLAGDLPAVVATNAFGMGIDRPDIRLVAHYALPGTLEASYQEAGRAGRDGEPAQAAATTICWCRRRCARRSKTKAGVPASPSSSPPPTSSTTPTGASTILVRSSKATKSATPRTTMAGGACEYQPPPPPSATQFPSSVPTTMPTLAQKRANVAGAFPGIGAPTARRLVAHFGSLEAAFEAPVAALLQVPRLKPQMAAALHNAPLQALQHELEALAAAGLPTLTSDDAAYPANLRHLADAPPLLFLRGTLQPADAAAVAIVGSRRPSPPGAALATILARELAARGLVVVSGLALGLDAAAHRGALEAPGGRTLAVPGSGLRALHPRANLALAQDIAARGALLSELHPGAPVTAAGLMARDRIVSGLSRALIVIEARQPSGSLGTAAKANRQRRPVFAVPGSPGCDALIAAGAIALQPEQAHLDTLAAHIRGHAPGEAPQQLGLW